MSQAHLLSASEVMSGLYEMFKANGSEIKLPNTVKVAICEEASVDYGYFAHDSVVVFKVGEKSWWITLGRATTGESAEDILSDPASEYDCDLVAVRFPEADEEFFLRLPEEEEKFLLEEISSALKHNVDRQFSLLFSMYDGRFNVNYDGMFGQLVKARFLLPFDGNCFLARKPRYRRDGVHANGTPIVIREAKYYPLIVESLYNICSSVLATVK